MFLIFLGETFPVIRRMDVKKTTNRNRKSMSSIYIRLTGIEEEWAHTIKKENEFVNNKCFDGPEHVSELFRYPTCLQQNQKENEEYWVRSGKILDVTNFSYRS